MRSYNTLRGRLFALDRELENFEVGSDNDIFSEALERRKRTKKPSSQKSASKKNTTAKETVGKKQKATAVPKKKDALGAAGKAVKQAVDTALGTTAPTPSQDTPTKPTYTISALTSDTILEQLEAQTKVLENMVQKMRPAVRLLEEWEEDDEIDLIRPKLNAIIGAIHRFKSMLQTF